MNRMSQSPLDLKLAPITRAQRKKLKLQEDNDMIAYVEDALNSKIEKLDGQGKLPKLFTMCSIVKEQSKEQFEEIIPPLMAGLPLPRQENLLVSRILYPCLVNSLRVNVLGSLIMSTDGHIPTQSYQEGTNERSMRHVNETFWSLQQSIEGLAMQYQSVARDIEELKKRKSSATIEQRVGDNIGGFNSPHHQRPFDNISSYGYHDMPIQSSHPLMKVDIKEDHKF
ncbi:hypothetical protein M9H77_12463 [Catharanthus roseus]|uniref:Uncharacterized protein n=1 Tax=Catharanthus roseus TaxID=4058 RepID=A0ACC0BHN3_CATRO|nr:hypothetical protein M9H77_12463 [Catharanthus roseus]